MFVSLCVCLNHRYVCWPTPTGVEYSVCVQSWIPAEAGNTSSGVCHPISPPRLHRSNLMAPQCPVSAESLDDFKCHSIKVTFKHLELIKEKKCAFSLKWQRKSPLIPALDGNIFCIKLHLGWFKVYIQNEKEMSKNQIYLWFFWLFLQVAAF